MEQVTQYLHPDVVAKLGSMEVRARLVVEGFITGLHRSPFHGFSSEFSEHRQYRSGDEIKHIDWKVYARTDRYYVKQYEDETNLRCLVALDSSASMNYSSDGNISKFQYASYLAAALCYLVLKQRDAAGLALYNTDVVEYLPPRQKQSYIQELLRVLSSAQASKGTGTAVALNRLAERVTRRGLIVVISDLLDDPNTVLQALRHFRHNKHDVLVLHILDPREVDFDFGSAAVFKDMEGDGEITTHPLHVKKSYTNLMSDFCNTIKRGCYAQNVDYALITTDTPFDVALQEYLVKRKNSRS